jgi:hypothetical protein
LPPPPNTYLEGSFVGCFTTLWDEEAWLAVAARAFALASLPRFYAPVPLVVFGLLFCGQIQGRHELPKLPGVDVLRWQGRFAVFQLPRGEIWALIRGYRM